MHYGDFMIASLVLFSIILPDHYIVSNLEVYLQRSLCTSLEKILPGEHLS
jgi:hypothetical protein